jgi:hypothetical protein
MSKPTRRLTRDDLKVSGVTLQYDAGYIHPQTGRTLHALIDTRRGSGYNHPMKINGDLPATVSNKMIRNLYGSLEGWLAICLWADAGLTKIKVVDLNSHEINDAAHRS